MSEHRHRTPLRGTKVTPRPKPADPGILLPANWYHGQWPGLAGTTQVIGQELVNKYALPFELVSVLLLAALIGAVVLARRDDES